MDAIQIHASILFKLKKRIGNNMNLQHITILTLFIEGLLSFFSPCVLPILPVYIGILAGQGEEKQSGEIIWDRRKVFTNTFLFISGIAAKSYSISSKFGRNLNSYYGISAGRSH